MANAIDAGFVTSNSVKDDSEKNTNNVVSADESYGSNAMDAGYDINDEPIEVESSDAIMLRSKYKSKLNDIGVVYNSDTKMYDMINADISAFEYDNIDLYLNQPIANLDKFDSHSQRGLEELTMVSRVNDERYLAALRPEDRTELINNYLDWSETHLNTITCPNGIVMPVFGYTDVEFSGLDDTNDVAMSIETIYDSWKVANISDLAIHDGVSIEDAMDVYGVTVESEIESEDVENVESEVVEDVESNSSADVVEEDTLDNNIVTNEETEQEVDSSANGTSKGAWSKITTTIGVLGTAFIDTVKAIYNEKIEPWLESKGFIKQAQENVVDNEVDNDGSQSELNVQELEENIEESSYNESKDRGQTVDNDLGIESSIEDENDKDMGDE